MTNLVLYTDDGGGELKLPAYPGDAGLDVMVIGTHLIVPHSIKQIPIGIRVAVPSGSFFTFMTRSSAVAQGLFVIPTVVDEGYRGPLFLFVMNATDEHREVRHTTRIAQIVLLPNVLATDGLLVKKVLSLPPSTRGTNGFGSSGGSNGHSAPVHS